MDTELFNLHTVSSACDSMTSVTGEAMGSPSLRYIVIHVTPVTARAPSDCVASGILALCRVAWESTEARCTTPEAQCTAPRIIHLIPARARRENPSKNDHANIDSIDLTYYDFSANRAMFRGLRGQMFINLATWTHLKLNVLHIFVVFQRLTQQTETPAFLEALSRLERSFEALKGTQMLRILRELHQHLLMVLRVMLQGIAITAEGIPKLSLYIFYDGKRKEPMDL